MSVSDIIKVLAVEDNEAIGTVIHDTLADAGYQCVVINEGAEGLRQALSGNFDLVILDVNLPSISGLDICERVKHRNPQMPVIMLTARTAEADIVSGLELGADDYIPKPFRPRELLARVRARLRERTSRAISDALQEVPQQELSTQEFRQPLRIGELEICFERMRVTKSGAVLDLSVREFEFIALLAQHPGRPFGREELLRHIWETESESYEANVSVMVSRVRKKLEVDPNNPRYLLTVRGVGYRFVEPIELRD